MDHLEKLQTLLELIRELDKLSDESGVPDYLRPFDHIKLQLPEKTIITLYFYNDSGGVEDNKKFPLSMVDELINQIREKIKYRKKIIDGKMGFVEGEKQ